MRESGGGVRERVVRSEGESGGGVRAKVLEE